MTVIAKSAKQDGLTSEIALEAVLDLKARISQAVIGQQAVIERLLLALLANGHVLLEGMPGLAKTRSVKAMTQALDVELSRIQFTPDLLPSDITGTEIYHHEGGRELLEFQPGPIFSSLILADEINRAPAKVQAALLEAMEERQVTVAGKTRPLPQLFMVLATQNPIEQEGTYPLPEAQLDRFLLHVRIDYPDQAAEAQIMRLVRGEENREEGTDISIAPIAASHIFVARREIQHVYVSESMETYMLQLVAATRRPEDCCAELKGLIDVGASPRASLALDRCSRAHAWLQQRDYVSPDDVRAVVHDVLRHRIIPSYQASAEGITRSALIDEILRWVPVI